MATKDWEKIGKNAWQKHNQVIDISNNKVILMTSFYNSNRSDREEVIKLCKTKQQAIKFARQYMRKH